MVVEKNNKFDAVYTLLDVGNGYIAARSAMQHGVSNKHLQRMTDQGLIERVAHGLYASGDTFPDPYFIAQFRCYKGVFSHETALFLHDFSDREPLRLMMTIPTGWNTRILTDESMMFFYTAPRRAEYGVCEVETPLGMNVRAYNMERTLCDCVINIDRLDRDIVITAIKRYARSPMRDVAKLLEYATEFNIRDIMYRYMEVLV